MDRASLYQLIITAVFEPAGEECGTTYDEAVACPDCGAGRRQISPLRLDLRKAPKRKHFARTIADEWICSQEAAEAFVRHALHGFELRLVEHKARRAFDPVDLSTVPSGRRVLERAEREGIELASWQGTVWVNAPEQAADLRDADFEARRRAEATEDTRGSAARVVSDCSNVGAGPTGRSDAHWGRSIGCVRKRAMSARRYGGSECPVRGLGFGRLPDGVDLTVTREFVGDKRGVLMPAPLLIVSRRFRDGLEERGFTGYRLEVAHVSSARGRGREPVAGGSAARLSRKAKGRSAP